MFSWTSRLPQRQINVFIRGGILHCIQRGLEDSVFDISNIPHSRPVVNKKLIRSMYNSPFDDGGDIETSQKPFSGTVSYDDGYSKVEMIYLNGLLLRERSYYSKGRLSEDKTISTSTEYDYTNHNGVYYISRKNFFNMTSEDGSISETTVETNYKHQILFGKDSLYLTSETEVTEKKEGSVWGSTEITEKTIRQTFHHPLGNGFYSTTVYVDGEHQGSTISQGAPSNSVSQYTIESIRKIFGTSAKDNSYDAQRSRLAAIVDTSFPVRELDLIEQLTEDLKWLNRKIQESVSVNLTSKIENGIPDLKHIVDFTERVRLDGVEYFLVSNNVSLTPRSLIQKLQLVRWTV